MSLSSSTAFANSRLDEQDCLPVQRNNVCTSFDKECMSVHVPPVRPMSVSSSCFVPLSLLFSLPTAPPCHPCPPPPSHPQQRDQHSTKCRSHCEHQSESHDSSHEVLQRTLVPHVPRNRRTLALLHWKRLIRPSHTFLSWEFKHIHSVFPRETKYTDQPDD